MARAFAYGLMAISLTSAVLLKGGVYPGQWQWIALCISVAALIAVLSESKSERTLRMASGSGPFDNLALILLGSLLAWMVLQLVPLPPFVIHLLSPERWDVVTQARAATGQSSRGWFALSAAPAATMERLLQVIPVIAAFVAAREMGWWWRNWLWGAAAPVLFVAWLESVLALVLSNKSGTYVNHNHFAGLLEMAVPLISVWAVVEWRAWKTHYRDMAPPVLGVILLGTGACLWMGLMMSLSRMGVISALAALVLTTVMLLVSQREKKARIPGARLAWKRVAILPMSVLVFVPTGAMVQRFFDINSVSDKSGDIRVKIWQDTTQVVAAYKWTGVGLGAYEQGLYRHRMAEPASTIDFAHNDYLQIIAELGPVGSVLLAALATWILWRTFSVAVKIRIGNWAVALGLMGSFVALGLHSFTDFNLYIPANALALAWLAGIADSPGLTKVLTKV